MKEKLIKHYFRLLCIL